MEDISIRELELRDVAAVVRVANQAFVEGGRFTSRFGTMVVDLMRELSGWHLVAEVGGEVVGFVVCRSGGGGEAPAVVWIATHPSWQGKGVGGKLLSEYEERARAEGYAKVVVGTPFAQSFYLGHGYTPIGAKWRMVRELVGVAVDAPGAGAVRQIDLEDLPALTDSLDEAKRAEFVRSFMQVYEREGDKSLWIERSGAPAGILVGETDPYQYDLARALFVSYDGLDTLKDLLDAFAHVCSKKGKRWAGFAPEGDEAKNAAEDWGWCEAHLPTWYVCYEFEKSLGC